MNIHLDPNAFTLGDYEDFEDATGKTLDDALKPVPVLDEDGNRAKDAKGRPLSEVKVSPKVLTVLVWLSCRASDPDFTLADARKVRITDLSFASDKDDEAAEGNG